MAEALINHQVLEWAVHRAETTPEELAKKLQAPEPKVSKWIAGDARPTFRQAQRAADILGIPFGYLYLSKVPIEGLPVPDFRTVGNRKGYIDPDTRLLLRQIVFRQEWYREYRQSEGFNKLDFVGRFSTGQANPEEVAQHIRLTLGSDAIVSRSRSSSDYLDKLMRQAEDIGIWVMNTSIVGNNTHKDLSVAHFRGLSISDDVVPAVLINGQDARSAQIFTFAHELAHLWLGGSGLSNVQLERPTLASQSFSETLCNRIAAEFLVPRDEFEERWRQGPTGGLESIATRLSKVYRVSRVVLARRALDLKLIGLSAYRKFYDEERRRWAADREKMKRRKRGGHFAWSLAKRNGRDFTMAVLRAAIEGRLLFRDAGALLGVKPGRIRSIHEALDE